MLDVFIQGSVKNPGQTLVVLPLAVRESLERDRFARCEQVEESPGFVHVDCGRLERPALLAHTGVWRLGGQIHVIFFPERVPRVQLRDVCWCYYIRSCGLWGGSAAICPNPIEKFDFIDQHASAAAPDNSVKAVLLLVED